MYTISNYILSYHVSINSPICSFVHYNCMQFAFIHVYIYICELFKSRYAKLIKVGILGKFVYSYTCICMYA